MCGYFRSLGLSNEVAEPGSDSRLFRVMTGRAFPFMVTCILLPWWENKRVGVGTQAPPTLPPHMPAPRQRSSHTGDRGILPHLRTHFIAVGWAPRVCTAPKCSNCTLTVSH